MRSAASTRSSGDFNQADALLRSALDERRALSESNHADVAESTVALGLLRDRSGEVR